MTHMTCFVYLDACGLGRGQFFETEKRRAVWETLWNAVSKRMDACLHFTACLRVVYRC